MTEEELKDLEYDLKLMAAESKIFDTDAIRGRIDKLFRYNIFNRIRNLFHCLFL